MPANSPNNEIKRIINDIPDSRFKQGAKYKLKIHADLLYTTNEYIQQVVSPQLFQNFISLSLEEEYLLEEAVKLKTREAIFNILKPRIQKLIKSAIEDKFKDDIIGLIFPPEAEFVLQNDYPLASSAARNKAHSKTFRREVYNDFVTQYMDFIKVEMDLIYQKHKFGINLFGDHGRLYSVMSFLTKELLLRYLDEEYISETCIDMLFDKLHFVYEDSHNRRQRELELANKSPKSSRNTIVTPAPGDTEIEKLVLPVDRLHHINAILIHINASDHKKFIKYMTKVYYQKEPLRLRHLMSRYMPHIQSDAILPWYNKAVDDLGFVKDPSIQQQHGKVSGVVHKTVNAIKTTFTPKPRAKTSTIVEQYMSPTLKNIVESKKQVLTPELLVQIFKEMGYRFWDEKSFTKESAVYLLNSAIQSELLKRLQKDESNMWLQKAAIRSGAKYERIGLDGQKLKLVKQKNTILWFTNMSDYTNKVNKYFTDEGRDFDKEMGSRDRAAAQQQYKANTTD